LCHLIADPHGLALTGQYFEAQTVGDWVAYDGPRVHISYRGVKMDPYPWVGIMTFFATIDGHIVKTHWNGDGMEVTVDGVTFDIDTPSQRVFGEITISWSSAGIKLIAPGEEADLDLIRPTVVTPWWKPGMHFWNLYVRTDRDPSEVKGVCMHQWIGSNRFDHPKPPVRVNLPVPKCDAVEEHENFCRRFLNIREEVHNCVFDRCLHFPKEEEKKVIKRVKIIKRKPIRTPSKQLIQCRAVINDYKKLLAEPKVIVSTTKTCRQIPTTCSFYKTNSCKA
jgi:hypothetical protein